MQIKLDCGDQVRVFGFQFRSTYGGLLEGRPNDRINNRTIESARKCSDYGPNRRVHLIEPAIDNSGGCPRLPSNILSVWLCDLESQLVVVWFRDAFGHLPLLQVIEEAVEPLNWDDLAESFAF